jgi:hypothetical protein
MTKHWVLPIETKRSTAQADDDNDSPPCRGSVPSLLLSPPTMTLPRPIRILAAVTICIFLFLFFQVFQSESGQVKLPESPPVVGMKYQEWDHDPQLDRKC